MSIKYVRIGIAIHDLDIAEEADVDFLVGCLRESTYAALMGNQRETFKWNPLGLENSIEVEVEERAGKAED